VPKKQHLPVCIRRIASKWPNMSHHRPPICLRGALESCVGVYDYGEFGFCWSLRSKIIRSTAISLTEQLKSQLPQVQQLAIRQLVPYIVRDSQWQCGPTPTAPSMAHPARRVMPNEPVGRKLQHFKCISKVACCACMCADRWCPFGHSIGGFWARTATKGGSSISPFTDGPSAPASTAVGARAPVL
jgi:hypothetical protein